MFELSVGWSLQIETNITAAVSRDIVDGPQCHVMLLTSKQVTCCLRVVDHNSQTMTNWHVHMNFNFNSHGFSSSFIILPSYTTSIIIVVRSYFRAAFGVLLWVLADCSCKNSKVLLPYCRPSKIVSPTFGRGYLLIASFYMYYLSVEFPTVSTCFLTMFC